MASARARYAALGGLGLAAAAMVAVVTLDLVNNPRDIWAALCFLAGTLVGASADLWRNRA